MAIMTVTVVMVIWIAETKETLASLAVRMTAVLLVGMQQHQLALVGKRQHQLMMFGEQQQQLMPTLGWKQQQQLTLGWKQQQQQLTQRLREAVSAAMARTSSTRVCSLPASSGRSAGTHSLQLAACLQRTSC
jgi:hypothetical protein